MTLEVIGPGFGRSGTRSLKDALDHLGLGPCHHMAEVFAHPEQVPYWQAIAAKKSVDWSAVFQGYRSQVDWPGAHVWRELIVAYPTAKVVLTVRPEATWWDSFSKTIGKLTATYQELPLPPHVRAMFDAWTAVIGPETFGGRFDDRDTALARTATAPRRFELSFRRSGSWCSTSPRAGSRSAAAGPEHPIPSSEYEQGISGLLRTALIADSWAADAKMADLLPTLADCPKARSVSVHDRCKARYEGL